MSPHLASSVAITAANKSNYWSEAQQRHAVVLVLFI
jgi:hypothetical protein